MRGISDADYIILQVTDNDADSVKLLAPEGKKNEKKAFILRVKAVSGIKFAPTD